MKKPPCYNDGKDCPKRHVGCRDLCKEWNDWLVIHEAEKEQTKKDRYNEADTFLCDQPKRKRLARKRDYMRERSRR